MRIIVLFQMAHYRIVRRLTMRGMAEQASCTLRVRASHYRLWG